MEPQSQGSSGDANASSANGHRRDSNVSVEDANPFAACNLCGRTIQSGELEIFSLCGDCKFLLLEDFGTPVRHSTQRHSSRRRRRRSRRLRHSSSESTGDIPSQQFTRLIRIARQSLSTSHGYEDQRTDNESLVAAAMTLQTSSNTTPSSSRRWRGGFSDTESDDFDNLESRYGETESNASFSHYRFLQGDTDAVSFNAYGEDSDASTDIQGFLEADIFLQPDNRSEFDFDTDIDPMNAGYNQWNSDEEDNEWEEANAEDGRVMSGVSGTRYGQSFAHPSESYGSITGTQQYDSPEFERVIRERIVESRLALSRNIFNGFEDIDLSLNAANAGDFLDERGFEELLEQLAESDNSRRGAPPASVSFVRNLPRVIIDEEQVKDSDSLACAICKELFMTGNETTQLPCRHLYHPRCILPWLNSRNSCPLCRYELPTDDIDYEEGKQNAISHEIEDASEEDSSDDDTEAAREGEISAEACRGHGERDDNNNNNSGAGSGEGSRGRWLFVAAAPVVSLVGIVLTMWLSNSGRREVGSSHNQRGDRSRRWLPFF